MGCDLQELVNETHLGRISIVGFLTAAATGAVYGYMFGPPRGGGFLIGLFLALPYATLLWGPSVLLWRSIFPRLKRKVGVQYSAVILSMLFGFISPLPFWISGLLSAVNGDGIQLSLIYQVFAMSVFGLLFGSVPAVIGGTLGFVLFRNVHEKVSQ